MPEGPEVQLNLDLLKNVVENKKMIGINLLSGKYVDKAEKFKDTVGGYGELTGLLPATVTKVDRKGKFTWIELDNGWIIGITYGMTGRLTQDQLAKHQRFEFLIENSNPVYYIDPRNFGNLSFWSNRDGLNKKLAELGPDLLKNNNLTIEEVDNLFREKFNHKDISAALMSQKVLSGVGNYLRAEALYDSKIWPYAKVSDLADAELYDLYHSLLKVANEAYKVQSSWVKQSAERSAKQSSEKYVEEKSYTDYQDFMQIYNKKVDPNGEKVERTADKRTTWWVPSVQTVGKNLEE